MHGQTPKCSDTRTESCEYILVKANCVGTVPGQVQAMQQVNHRGTKQMYKKPILYLLTTYSSQSFGANLSQFAPPQISVHFS